MHQHGKKGKEDHVFFFRKYLSLMEKKSLNKLIRNEIINIRLTKKRLPLSTRQI